MRSLFVEQYHPLSVGFFSVLASFLGRVFVSPEAFRFVGGFGEANKSIGPLGVGAGISLRSSKASFASLLN